MLSFISDNPVTNQKKSGPIMADGDNLYVVSLDYCDGSGNVVTTAANFHVHKSTDAGVTWTAQDDSNGPGVYETSAIYNGGAGAPVSPTFSIDCTTQGNPFVVTTGVNDTLVVVPLTYGYVALTITCTLAAGSYGDGSSYGTVATALATALNAQVIANGQTLNTLKFTASGTNVICNSHDLTGSTWSFRYSGSMIDPTLDSNPATCLLSAGNTTGDTYTIGVSPYRPALFNTYDACYRDGKIYVCYIGITPGFMLHRGVHLGLTPFSPCLAIGVYDCGSDTWAYNILNGPDIVPLPYDSFYGFNVKTDLAVSIKVRASGDIVAAYAVGHSEGQTTADIYNTQWTVYDVATSTWSTPVQITTGHNTPVCSVLDSSDNFILVLSVYEVTDGSWKSAAYSFMVMNDNSTIALAPIDPTPLPYSSIVSNGDSFWAGPIQGIGIHEDRIILALSFGSPVSYGAFVYSMENTSSDIQAVNPWKIFRTPVYSNGANQYVGRADGVYFNSGFMVVLGQSMNPTGPTGTGNLAYAFGNNVGGSADAIFSPCYNAFPLPGNRIPYAVSCVPMSNGNLAVMYCYFDNGNTPYYFTRVAVFAPSSAPVVGYIANAAA
jgi:hypothetical protein